MARQDNQQNYGGKDSDQQSRSAGGRSTPGDYSDPNARQGSGRSSQSDRNQTANDDDDDDLTYGRQAYQADAGERSSQGGRESRSLNSQGRNQRDEE